MTIKNARTDREVMEACIRDLRTSALGATSKVMEVCIRGLRTSALGATSKHDFMATLLGLACVEICFDISNRRVDPTQVKCFGDLHDFVDANEYGGLCDDEIVAKAETLMPLRTDADTLATQELMDACNELQDKVNAWIESEQFKTNKWLFY